MAWRRGRKTCWGPTGVAQSGMGPPCALPIRMSYCCGPRAMHVVPAAASGAYWKGANWIDLLREEKSSVVVFSGAGGQVYREYWSFCQYWACADPPR